MSHDPDHPDDAVPPPGTDDDRLAGLIRAGFEPARSRLRDSVRIASAVRSVLGRASVMLRETDEPSAVVSPTPVSAQDDFPGYEVAGEVARGGVGTVLKGRDRELGREVAIKVLNREHGTNASMIHRFLEEAQIGGQLQHPGIVPVHAIGHGGRIGRPWFTMKFVKGRTLAALLGDRDEFVSERRRFVNVFEKVCEPVAYAHARGVVHRDLKPSNIMVGAFGEVMVMDWGLAKVLREGGSLDDRAAGPTTTSIETVRSSTEVHQSTTGSVMGTFGYMPPEQARGDVDAVDERSDVFALGAILCEILTGRPPYEGATTDEARRLASEADLSPARQALAACGAEPELTALVLDCLAENKVDRPRHAGHVVARLSAHLQSVEARVRDAEVGRARAEAKVVAEHRARRMTLIAAVALISVLAGGAAAYLWYRSDREARARDVSERLYGAMAELRATRDTAAGASEEEAPARWAAVLTAAKRTRSLMAHDAIRPEDRERAATLCTATDAQAAHARVERERVARDRRMVARLDRTWTLIEKPEEFVKREAAYADAFRDYGLDVDVMDTAAAATIVRDSAIRSQLISGLSQWAYFRQRLPMKSNRSWQRIDELLRAADDDPLRIRIRTSRRTRRVMPLIKIAESLDPAKEARETIHQLCRALISLDVLHPAASLLTRAQFVHPDDFLLHHTLAYLHRVLGEGPGVGLSHARAAVALRPDLDDAWRGLAEFVDSVGDRETLAKVRERLGDDAPPPPPAGKNAMRVQEAEAAYRADRSSLRKFAAFMWQLGEREGWDKAVARLRQEVERRPGEARLLALLARTLMQQHQHNAAVVAARRAVEIDERDPLTHAVLGGALIAAGRIDEGVAACRAALAIDDETERAYYFLAEAARTGGDRDTAIQHYRTAYRLQSYMMTLKKLTSVLLDDQQNEEAFRLCREYLKKDPANSDVLFNLARACLQTGRIGESVSSFRRVLRMRPRHAQSYYNMALGLFYLGDLDSSIDAYREAIRLRPNYAEAYCNLANVYRAKGKYSDGLMQIRYGHDLSKQRSGWRYRSDVWLAELERLAEAERDFEPDDPPDADDDPEMAIAWAEVAYDRGYLYAAAKVFSEVVRGAVARRLSAQTRGIIHTKRMTALIRIGVGQGKDTDGIDAERRRKYRQYAIRMMRNDLRRFRQLSENANRAQLNSVRVALLHWRVGVGLDHIRSHHHVSKLPEDERATLTELWAGVDKLFEQIRVPH